MTVTDWLYTVRSELQPVLDSESRIFQVGVSEELRDVQVSVTLIDQGDYYEAHVTSEPLSSGNMDDATNAVKQVVQAIGTDDDKELTSVAQVSTERENRWAEVHIAVDPERIRNL